MGRKAYGVMREALFEWVVEYCREHGGNFPTMRVIADGLGLATTSSVFFHLGRLRGDGRLRQIDRQWCVVGAHWLPPEPASPAYIELSAADDPSGQGGASSAHRGRRREAHEPPGPVLVSKPIKHHIRLCPWCGVGQPVAYRGTACSYCRRDLLPAEQPHA